MTCFAQAFGPPPSALDFAMGTLIVSFAIVLVLSSVGGLTIAHRVMAGADPPEDPSAHRCPYCGERLRPITVQDVEDPFPAEARWICPDCDPRRYFADRPAGKPDPMAEEV